MMLHAFFVLLGFCVLIRTETETSVPTGVNLGECGSSISRYIPLDECAQNVFAGSDLDVKFELNSDKKTVSVCIDCDQPCFPLVCVASFCVWFSTDFLFRSLTSNTLQASGACVDEGRMANFSFTAVAMNVNPVDVTGIDVWRMKKGEKCVDAVQRTPDESLSLGVCFHEDGE